jgi:hypothetical protein
LTEVIRPPSTLDSWPLPASVIALQEISPGVYKMIRTAILDLSVLLATTGTVAERLNAAATGLLFDDPADLPDDPPPGAKAEIRGSGDPEVDGYYSKTGAAGAPGWERLSGLDTAVMFAIEAIEAAVALKAPLDSPLLTGSPTAPTPSETGPHANDDRIATTAFVQALAALILSSSPSLGGSPTAPTPSETGPHTNDDRIATTAFVQAAIAALVNGAPAALDALNELAAALGNDPNFAATMAAQLGLKAPLDSPALTGSPTAPTPSETGPHANDDRIATTAFVQALAALILSSSPSLGGSPTAPTPSAGDNTTRLATTAFIAAAIVALKGGATVAGDTLKKLEDRIVAEKGRIDAMLAGAGGDADTFVELLGKVIEQADRITALLAGAPVDADTFPEVAARLSEAIVALRGGASGAGDTLKKLEDRVVAEKGRIDAMLAGAGGDADTFVELLGKVIEQADRITALLSGAPVDADTFPEVAARLSEAIAALKGGASALGDTLKKLEDRVVPFEAAFGVDQLLQTVLAEYEFVLPVQPGESRWAGLKGEAGGKYLVAFNRATGAARLLLDQASTDALTAISQLTLGPSKEGRWVGVKAEDDKKYLAAVDTRTSLWRLPLDQVSTDALTAINQLTLRTSKEGRWVGFKAEDDKKYLAAVDTRTSLWRLPLDGVSATFAYQRVSGSDLPLYGGPRLEPYRRRLLGMRLGGSSRRADINVFGDSWGTYSHWVTDASRVFTEIESYAYGGHGWWLLGPTSGLKAGYVSAATNAAGDGPGTWALVENFLSPSQLVFRSTTVGEKIVFTTPAGETAGKIAIVQGSARYQINGGAWTTVAGVGALNIEPLAGVPSAPGVPWTMTIETLSSPCDLAGLHLRNADNVGVAINRFARGGTTSAQMANIVEASFRTMSVAMDAAAMVITHATNDQTIAGGVGATPDEHYANLAHIIDLARLDAPDIAILISTPPQVREGPYIPRALYSEAARQCAVDHRTAHLDFQPLFGRFEDYRFGGPRPLLDDSLIHTDAEGDSILVGGHTGAFLGRL